MAKVFTVDATGARGASLAENVNDLNERQRDAFGADLSLSPATPAAQWSGIAGLGLTEVGEAGARAAVFGSSVDHAVGVHLDAIGSVADVRRMPATYSRVVATLTGVAGVVVPAGSRAKTTDDNEFATTEAVTLTAGGIDVTMQAVETGPVEAAAGALDRIVTGIEGWEGVTNAAAAVLGRDRQTDDEFKRVYRARTAHSSVAPLDGLRGAIVEAGGTRVHVRDNPTNAAAVHQRWTLPPHAILAVVEGGLDADIQRAVENHRGMGVATLTAIVGGTPAANGFANTGGLLGTWAYATSGPNEGEFTANATTLTVHDTDGGSVDTSALLGAIAAMGAIQVGPGHVFAVTNVATGTNTKIFTGTFTTGDVGDLVDGDDYALGEQASTAWPGEVEWDGDTVSDLDFSLYARTGAGRAAALTAGLSGATRPPTIGWTGYRFVAQYEWMPDVDAPEFGDNAVSQAFGLEPDTAAESPGPYVRQIDRPLSVTLTLSRRANFPSDGLERVQSSVLARVGGMGAIADRDLSDDARDAIRETLALIGAPDGYALGEELWSNDLLGAAERVPGTRITAISVQSDGADVSGEAVDLANRWTLAVSDLTLTVS